MDSLSHPTHPSPLILQQGIHVYFYKFNSGMDNNQGGHQTTADDEHGIEAMKQILLPSMSKDIEAAVNETAGQSSCTIFRVPQALAEEFAEACRPHIVSIGLYHHGELQLQTLEVYKWRYLHAMLERTQPRGISLGDLIDVVAVKEKMIRRCYSENTDNLKRLDLVKMMVLDGCFIIEFLREQSRMFPARLFVNSFVLVSIKRDLLRLENQVPYFVLMDLFKMTNVPRKSNSLADLALCTFSDIGEGLHDNQERWNTLKGEHLLDLFRLSLIPILPSDQQDNPVDKSSSLHMIRSASELRRVGIRFKKSEGSTFLDIKFDGRRRTIGIPNIAIHDDELKWILTNMVAFEQCRGQVAGHITSYAVFMGHLIRTADDVRLLRDCKVISNFGMSNDDFVHFFGDICKDVVIDLEDTYLSSHITNLNKSLLKYEGAHRCWAQVVNALRDNPWSALSGLAVLVTLAGVIQTVYAVLQYYHRK